MGYTAPLDQIVFSEDPDEVASMAYKEDGDGTYRWRNKSGVPDFPPGGPDSYVFYASTPYFKLVRDYGTHEAAVLFMHARTSPRGSVRQVVLRSNGLNPSAFHYPGEKVFRHGALYFDYFAQPRGSSFSRRSFQASDLIIPPHDGHWHMFAGQPDPADASHFTIKYEIDHGPGTIDGWLQPDDTVKLQIRDGPAAGVATTRP